MMKDVCQWQIAGIVGLMIVGFGTVNILAQNQNPRIAVGDQEAGMVRVMDTTDGSMIAEFPLPGPASQLNTTESGRYAGVVIGDDVDQVHFLDSGVSLVPHDGHSHAELEEPNLRPLQLGGAGSGAANPSHFVAHAGQIAVHFDGSPSDGIPATVYVLHEADLLSDQPAAFTTTTTAHHGVAEPLAAGGFIWTDADPDDVNALPSGVTVRDASGNILQTFNNKAGEPHEFCLGLHGSTGVGPHVLFGCHQDDTGILIMTPGADGIFTARKVLYPDPFRRTSVITSHPALSFAVGQYGQFGADSYYASLIRIDPESDTIPYRNILALSDVQCGFAFERERGEVLFVVTRDGYGHVYHPNHTGEDVAMPWLHLGSLQVTEPEFACTGGFAVGQGYAYVSRPDQGDVLEINLSDLAQTRSLPVPGVPGTVAVFGWWETLGEQ
jgi:hypothetical protein